MSTIPADVLAEFQSVSLQRLDAMSRCLLRLDEEPDTSEVAETLLREAHTLKGDARILGLEPLVQLVHRFEDLLGALRRGGFGDKAGLDVGLTGLDVIQRLLCEDLSQPLDADAAAARDAYLQSVSDVLAGVPVGPVDSEDSLSLLRSAVAPRLAQIRAWLDALELDMTDAEAGGPLLAELGRLKQRAQELELGAFHVHVWSLESEVRELVSDEACMFGDVDIVRKGIDELEATLSAALPEAERAQRLQAFNELCLFDPEEAAAEEAAAAAEAAGAAAPEVDEPAPVPQEMLDTFQASALVRIDSFSRCLLHLEEQPDDEGVADELLREAHTLKGDSRVCGLMDLGHLVHRFEDLLLLARKGRFGDQSQIDLALTGVDLIHRVLSEDLTAPIPPGIAAANASYLLAIDAAERGVAAAPPVLAPASVPTEPGGATAAPPPPAASASGSAPKTKSGDTKRREFLHVPVDRVEHLIHLAGELNLRQTQQDRIVADMRRLVHDCRDTIARFREDHRLEADVAEKFSALAREMGARIQEMRDDGFQNGLRLTELQDSVSGMQLVEVRSVFGKYPRAVRSMCRDLGKQCKVVLEGEEVAVDKKVLMQIEDALLHLVRNSVDHGIESPQDRAEVGKPERGTLRLTARNKGAFVEVEIADDGGGIDARKIAERLVSKGLASAEEVAAMSEDVVLQQIFRPGFSTVETVTDISGRGVGMDVVKRQIDGMGGSVQIHTEVGVGTRFVLSLPVSASVTQAMVFRQDNGLYAVPSAMIESMLHVLPAAVQRMGSQSLLRVEEELVSLHDLDGILGFRVRTLDEPFWRVAVVRLGDRRIAVRVRGVLGERKLVQQASDEFLAGLSLLSGTARIEGGELVTVLNAAHLIRSATSGGGQAGMGAPSAALGAGEAGGGAAEASGAAAADEAPARVAPEHCTVLIVEDSDITRRMLVAAVGKLGYRTIEAVNGREGLQAWSRHRPELVMTDLDMPVMSGIELLRQLREEDVETPVVVMTSRETAESRKEALDSGANAYIVKSRDAHQRLRDTFAMLLGVGSERAA